MFGSASPLACRFRDVLRPGSRMECVVADHLNEHAMPWNEVDFHVAVTSNGDLTIC